MCRESHLLGSPFSNQSFFAQRGLKDHASSIYRLLQHMVIETVC